MTHAQARLIKAALEAAGKTSSPIYQQAIKALQSDGQPRKTER